jgi:aspartokinase
MQKEITIWAIKIALSRIAKEKQKSSENIIFKPSNFYVKKWIEIINIPYNSNIIEKITQILNKKVDKKEYYFSIIQWNSEINIIFCEEIREIIYEIIKDEKINISIKNLGAIWINLNERMLETKGMFYTITKKLAFAWINVLEIVSTYKEIMIFVDEKDIKVSLNLLIS